MSRPVYRSLDDLTSLSPAELATFKEGMSLEADKIAADRFAKGKRPRKPFEPSDDEILEAAYHAATSTRAVRVDRRRPGRPGSAA